MTVLRILSQNSTQVTVQAAPQAVVSTVFQVETRSETMGTGVSLAGAFYYAVTGMSLCDEIISLFVNACCFRV